MEPWRYLQSVLPPSLRPQSLQAVFERRIEDVSADRIKGCLPFVLATTIGHHRARTRESKASFWARQNEQFGRAVASADWGTADTVYAFNGAALEIFERAHRSGLRCILDQTSAPWRHNTRLLLQEQEKWPRWEEHPADVDSTGQMIRREEAEWKLADQIICGSPFVVEAIRNASGPVEKCRVVTYPIPEHSARREPNPICSARALRVLFVGTLQLRKGIQYVFESARHLAGERFEFRAVGPSALTQSAERALATFVDVRGQVGRNDVWRHYQWADVFFLPTLSEGSANVCWEALSTGTYVLTSSAAGLTEADADICPGDPEVMVDRLRRLRDLTARPKGRHGRFARVRSVKDYGVDLRQVLCRSSRLASSPHLTDIP